MSDDLINRSDAIDAIEITPFEDYGDYETVKAVIEQLPSASRPQGEWIVHFDDIWPEESTMECSVCHEEQPLEIDDNFCPNCGARMKGSRR